MNPTLFRLRVLGIVLAVVGLAIAGAGALYGAPTANDGLDSAQAMYETQGVSLDYDDAGRLLDRGDPAQAQTILAMLEEEWAYPVDHKNLDPEDPLVNTRDELMYQYAVITYHVLHGEQTVVLSEEDVPITYRGLTYAEAGEYDIVVGAYYAQLDRSHPIEGQLRQAWSPLALALTSYLAAGHANQAAGELALYTSLAVAGIGALFAVAGAGMVWVTYGAKHPTPVRPAKRAPGEHRMQVRGHS